MSTDRRIIQRCSTHRRRKFNIFMKRRASQGWPRQFLRECEKHPKLLQLLFTATGSRKALKMFWKFRKNNSPIKLWRPAS